MSFIPLKSLFDRYSPDVLDHMWVGGSQVGNAPGCTLAMIGPDGKYLSHYKTWFGAISFGKPEMNLASAHPCAGDHMS